MVLSYIIWENDFKARENKVTLSKDLSKEVIFLFKGKYIVMYGSARCK